MINHGEYECKVSELKAAECNSAWRLHWEVRTSHQRICEMSCTCSWQGW